MAFLGSFVNPKAMAVAVAAPEGAEREGAARRKLAGVEEAFKLYHSYLYKFSLEKLFVLTHSRPFALAFCFYFQTASTQGRLLERLPRTAGYIRGYA